MPLIDEICLSEKCLDFIVKNIDKFCVKSGKEPLEEIDSDICKSPCDQLPSFLLDKLVMMLMETCRLDKKCLEFLISTNLRTLDLSQCQQQERAHLLCIGSIRSQNLKTLKLGCGHIDPEFLNCISKFKCLQFLEFSQCSDGDKIMRILGAHCTDLRELHVRDEVSDSGIRDLCVTGKCKSIHTLILTETNVTKLGIKMVLDNLPALRILQHPSTLEVLSQITNWDRYLLFDLFIHPNVPFTKYRISERGAFYKSLRIRRLHVVISKEFGAFQLKYLRPYLLLNDEDLIYFKISVTPGQYLYSRRFSLGMADLLQDIGISLKSLSIARHYLVDIPWIIKYCPKLLSLTLEQNDGYKTGYGTLKTSKQERQTVLKKLKRLHLSGDIPEKLLIILLSSFSLIYVCIDNCDYLTDEVLEVTANLHQFQNLKHFEISFCSNITSKGIDCLMNERNPIEVMKLNHCHNLSNDNIENWKKEKSEKNWKLSISGSVTVT